MIGTKSYVIFSMCVCIYINKYVSGCGEVYNRNHNAFHVLFLVGELGWHRNLLALYMLLTVFSLTQS